MMKRAVLGLFALALTGCVETQSDPTWAYDAIAAAPPPQNLERGMAFPLSSGTSLRLNHVAVQWITASQSIEVAVLLDAFTRETDSSLEDLVDFGEFCLRYGRQILLDAVPAEQQPRISQMAVLYRTEDPSRPVRVSDLGFGFVVLNSQCTLAPPFPANLVDDTVARARTPL